jgi:hypothetical protein
MHVGRNIGSNITHTLIHVVDMRINEERE